MILAILINAVLSKNVMYNADQGWAIEPRQKRYTSHGSNKIQFIMKRPMPIEFLKTLQFETCDNNCIIVNTNQGQQTVCDIEPETIHETYRATMINFARAEFKNTIAERSTH